MMKSIRSAAIGRRNGSWDFLSGDLQRDQRNLGLVMETVGELYGTCSAEERMRHAVDRAVAVTEAERGILLIARGDVLGPRVARDAQGRDLPLDLRYSHSVVREVWKTGRAVKRNFDPLEDRIPTSQSIPVLQLQSIMAVPLRYERRRVGVLYVDARSRTKDFTDSEHKVFLALGGLVSSALETARLADETLKQECLARRVRLAREVQERLLPQDISAPEGFDIAGVGEVCHELSGDYYDVLGRGDGGVSLVIGDVSGHNIAAALHMVTTRALVHRLVEDEVPPADALGNLNQVLGRDMRDEDFMSLFLGVLDPCRRSVTYASAGHNPPLLRRADGTVEELEKTGPVLNLVPHYDYGTRGPVALGRGDVLLLYTDGLTEGRDRRGRLWGEEGLRRALDRCVPSGRSAAQILQCVLTEAEAHRGRRPLDDDITALAVRAL